MMMMMSENSSNKVHDSKNNNSSKAGSSSQEVAEEEQSKSDTASLDVSRKRDVDRRVERNHKRCIVYIKWIASSLSLSFSLTYLNYVLF